MPSTRAIQANAIVMAAPRLRTIAPSPTPRAAYSGIHRATPTSVCQTPALAGSKPTPLAENQAAATIRAVMALRIPYTNPRPVYATSLATITRDRRGVDRNVSVMVPSRYSPATARMPSTSTSMELRPAWHMSSLAAVGLLKSRPAMARPLMPATMRVSCAAGTSQGAREVRSLKSSLATSACIFISLVGGAGGRPSQESSGAHRGRRLVRRGESQERCLE